MLNVVRLAAVCDFHSGPFVGTPCHTPSAMISDQLKARPVESSVNVNAPNKPEWNQIGAHDRFRLAMFAGLAAAIFDI